MPLTAVVAIFCCVLLALAAVFAVIGFARGRRTRGWVRARGMVVNRHGGLDGWPEGYPTFEWFDRDGRRHRHTSMVRSQPGPRPGTPVDVLYDPMRPERGQMDTFVQSGRVFLLVAALLAGFAVVGGAVALWVVHVVAEALPLA